MFPKKLLSCFSECYKTTADEVPIKRIEDSNDPSSTTANAMCTNSASSMPIPREESAIADNNVLSSAIISPTAVVVAANSNTEFSLFLEKEPSLDLLECEENWARSAIYYNEKLLWREAQIDYNKNINLGYALLFEELGEWERYQKVLNFVLFKVLPYYKDKYKIQHSTS